MKVDIPDKQELLAGLGYYSNDYKFLELLNEVLFNLLKGHKEFNDKYTK